MSSIHAATASPSPLVTSLYPKAKAQTTTTGASSTSSTSGSNSDQLSVSSLGSTFLQLLTQELQNQDPTAPVDSTQMVGQMISLNQLDQLASINQTLTNQFPTAAGTATAGSTSNSSSPTPSMTGAGSSANANFVTAGSNQIGTAAAMQAALQSLSAMPGGATPNTSVSLPNF